MSEHNNSSLTNIDRKCVLNSLFKKEQSKRGGHRSISACNKHSKSLIDLLINKPFSPLINIVGDK